MVSVRFYRPFLWSLALFAVLVGISCRSAPTPSPEVTRYAFERPEMGVPFRIVLYATNQSAAKVAADAAFERVKQLNDIMSDYDADSELSKLTWRDLSAADLLHYTVVQHQPLADEPCRALVPGALIETEAFERERIAPPQATPTA